MWSTSNERFSDRDGCGDELYLDARMRTSSVLAGLYGDDPLRQSDAFDEADDFAAH